MDVDPLESGRTIIAQEAAALRAIHEGLGEDFVRAVRLIYDCTGRVIVTGVGKAGIMGQKISATLASTGTPSHWLHAVEARHGDLGRVQARDVVLALSKSGATEVVELLMPLKKLGVKIIAITAERSSVLARYSDVVLDIGPVEEACPLGLAPSSSTTAMVALGDALALTVFRLRDWSPEQYAFYHPGGELGRKLIKVREVMRRGRRNPVAPSGVTLRQALEAMSVEGSPGSVSIVDGDGHLAGVFTDGDLRRLLRQGRTDALDRPVHEVMTTHPRTLREEDLAADAYRILREQRIDNLPVVDESGVPVGLVDVQDWLDLERGIADDDAPEDKRTSEH